MGWQGLRYQVRPTRSLDARYHVHNLPSYYLSSHHIDICAWILQDIAVPTRVVASAATGIATSEPYNCVPETEDTITLLVDWQSIKSPKHKGTGVYTASWTGSSTRLLLTYLLIRIVYSAVEVRRPLWSTLVLYG